MPATFVHRCREYALPTSYLGGILHDTSSPISSRDGGRLRGSSSGGKELAWLWTIPRGGLSRRVSKEENTNNATVILAVSYLKYIHLGFQE
jgi:hypothetical protein